MRKQIEVKETRIKEEIYCDLCGKLIARESYNNCSMCKREICYDCFVDKSEMDGTMIIPCPVCRSIGNKYTGIIKKEFAKADVHRDTAFETERKWGRESRKLKPEKKKVKA